MQVSILASDQPDVAFGLINPFTQSGFTELRETLYLLDNHFTYYILQVLYIYRLRNSQMEEMHKVRHRESV